MTTVIQGKAQKHAKEGQRVAPQRTKLPPLTHPVSIISCPRHASPHPFTTAMYSPADCRPVLMGQQANSIGNCYVFFCRATVRQYERNLPSQEFSGITCKKFWPLGGRFSAARGAEHNLSPPGHHVRERANPCATEQNRTKLAMYSMHISRQDHLWLALPRVCV